MEELKQLLITLAFNYYEHGKNLDTVAMEDEINPILEYVKKTFVPLDAEVKPATCEHNFQIAKRDYYKPTGQIGALGVMTYNQERTYSTLFCTKCGETKEIITS